MLRCEFAFEVWLFVGEVVWMLIELLGGSLYVYGRKPLEGW